MLSKKYVDLNVKIDLVWLTYMYVQNINARKLTFRHSHKRAYMHINSQQKSPWALKEEQQYHIFTTCTVYINFTFFSSK